MVCINLRKTTSKKTYPVCLSHAPPLRPIFLFSLLTPLSPLFIFRFLSLPTPSIISSFSLSCPVLFLLQFFSLIFTPLPLSLSLFYSLPSLPSFSLFLLLLSFSLSLSLSLSLSPPSLSPPSLFFCVSSSSSTTMNLKQWIPFTFSVTWVRAPTQVHSSTCHELAAAVCAWSGVPARHETQSPHTQRPQATQVSEGTVCADAALLWTWCGTGSGRI